MKAQKEKEIKKMTIKELYEWAVENGVENLDYKCDYGEGISEPDPPTIEEKFVVL